VDQAVIRSQLTTADSRVASKSLFAAILIVTPISFSNLLLSALESLVQTLQAAARTATEAVNARGDTVAARLQDIPNRIHEIAGHGVHQGAAITIAVVQNMSGSDDRTFHPVFPQGVEREEFE